MHTTTPPDTTLAVNLSAEITTAFAEAHALATTATRNARLAVARALECGRLLNLQKASVSHGGWQSWLAAHCPAISFPTARRYMRLAKRSQGSLLADATGLRQAYLATGVLPDCPRTRRVPDSVSPTVTFTRGLDQFRRWFNNRTDELPLDRWSPAARRLLRNELIWFAQLHQQLATGADHPLRPASLPLR